MIAPMFAMVGAAHLCAAQPAATPAIFAPPGHSVTVDLSFAGVSIGYAVKNGERTAFGASLGVGGNWLNYMAVGGRHFAESNGISYRTKDGSTNKELYELFNATVFVRRYFDAGRQLDVGLKGSGFLHSDSSDDDPAGGAFLGMNAKGTWWRWGRVHAASQLDAGLYTEGDPEFGVNVAPILLRLTFP